MNENKWVEIFHNKDCHVGKPCNKLAFRYRGSFEPNTIISANNIQWPDGRMADPGKILHCGSCGVALLPELFTEDGIG